MTRICPSRNRPHSQSPSFVLLVLGTVFCLVTASLARKQDDTVSLATVPVAVRKAIQGQLGGGQVSEISVDSRGGEQIYDVQILKNDSERGLAVAVDGRLISKEVAIEDTPPAVQKALKEQLAAGALVGIEQMFDEDGSGYDVEMKLDGKQRFFTLAKDGSLVSREVSLEETPEAVQKTIKEQVEPGELLRIDKTHDEDGSSYNIDAKQSTGPLTFSVTEGGALLSMEMNFSALPPEVQKSVTALLGKGRLKSVQKQFEGGEFTYDLEVAGMQKGEFTISKTGQLLSKRMSLAETSPAAQKTIKANLGSGKLLRIDQTNDEDGAAYHIDLDLNGKTQSFSVAEDGSFLGTEIDFSALPAEVQKSATAIRGQNSVRSVERQFDGTAFTYDIAIAKDGEERSFTLGADGTLQSLEVSLAETPAPVQKAIPAHLEGGTVEKIDRIIEGKSDTYDVKVAGGQIAEFTLGAWGQLLSKPVSLEKAPPAAQKTILENVGAGKIAGIELTFDADIVDYSIDVKLNGKTRSFSVADDGALLGLDIDFAALPPAVQKSINTLRGNSSIKSLQKQFDGGDVSYDVEIGRGGMERGFTVGGDGTLQSVTVELGETPAPVQKTIQEHLGGSAITKIDRVIEDKTITYDVETFGGPSPGFVVGQDGQFLSSRVSFSATSPSAQMTIWKTIGAGKVLRIDRPWNPKKMGDTPYEIHARANGKNLDFSVLPNGKFLGMDE